MDTPNTSFWINRDAAGIYVFSTQDGIHPTCKWARKTREASGSAFEPTYTAKATYAGDRVNGYIISNGLYINMAGSLKAFTAH